MYLAFMIFRIILYQFQAPIHTGGLSLDEMVAEYEESIIQSLFLGGQDRKDKEKVAE
ncbi:hypothetical protein [Peribacillus butanolivorans]|uniref:hypothetical protein n=1 Tax=Peribacillus butanolivorans TaxID=421767 RepID=UPI0013C34FA7